MALLSAGCLGPNVLPNGSSPTPTPHDMAVADHGPKTPPDSGGPTASGCNGVTEKGRCEISDKGQIAVVCDVAGSKLERFDCTAMQKVCVIDSTRGATCATLPPPVTTPGSSDGGVHPPVDMAHATPPPPPPPPPADMAHTTTPPPPAPRDMATAPPMCPSGVDYRGYCASATGSGASDTAIWCDPTTGQTSVVSCAALGKTCQVDACADGAYCCDAPATVDMALPPADPACDTLGYSGACESGHARWCSGGQVVDIDCGARGQTCGVDQCAQGAYCCDSMTASPPDMAQSSECDRLGVEGECASGVARWCAGGQIIELDCGARGETCEVDTCATGAYCCSG